MNWKNEPDDSLCDALGYSEAPATMPCGILGPIFDPRFHDYEWQQQRWERACSRAAREGRLVLHTPAYLH
jgi:hypothetical protein